MLPAPLNGGPTDSYVKNDSLTLARQSENGLPADYYAYLVTGGSGLSGKVPDTRIKNVNALPPGPFQLTNGDTFTYNSYAASPVHRFYQMWQQLDCSVAHATATNPSGCDAALFPWVETTVGAGTNGLAQPANFSTEYSPNATTTGEGSTAMGFYNVQNGDAPYFKYLADTYAMSDNFHQSVDGGTGANHIMFGHGDMIWFSDGKGNAGSASSQRCKLRRARQMPALWTKLRTPIRLPTPTTGTRKMVMAAVPLVQPSYGGGSYTDCADTTQPGVAPIVNYLKSLPNADFIRKCEAGHYYLLNNYNPGYFGNGNNAFTDTNANNTVFTIPPSSYPEHRRRPARQQHFLEVLRRPVEQLRTGSLSAELRRHRQGHGRVLQHLQSVPVRHFHHGQCRCPHGPHPGHCESLQRHQGWNTARRFHRQAQRTGRWSPVLLKAGSVRRLHQEDRR